MTTSAFTLQTKLCDDDGVVRRGAMHHGQDYPCTGSAHVMGEHIRCTSPAHTANRGHCGHPHPWGYDYCERPCLQAEYDAANYAVEQATAALEAATGRFGRARAALVAARSTSEDRDA